MDYDEWTNKIGLAAVAGDSARRIHLMDELPVVPATNRCIISGCLKPISHAEVVHQQLHGKGTGKVLHTEKCNTCFR